MKSLEGINNLHSLAAGPLLFAYHPGVGVDDAIHRITFWQDHFHSCRVLEALWLHGQWTTSSKDYSTWGFRSVCLKWWYAASGALRGRSSVPSSLSSILRTSDTTPQNAISRSSLMIQSIAYFIWCDLTTHLLINTSKMLIDGITVVWTLKYKSIYQNNKQD